MTLSSMEAALATNESMLAAVGALVSLRGIVQMVQSICSGILLATGQAEFERTARLRHQQHIVSAESA